MCMCLYLVLNVSYVKDLDGQPSNYFAVVGWEKCQQITGKLSFKEQNNEVSNIYSDC